MKQAKRATPASDVVPNLLVQTRRRCCLCVYLENDSNRKRVQIAHIDRDRSNSSESNLAPLCLDHHDEYDSRTSQSKGISPKEVIAYKELLISEIANGKYDFGPEPLAPQSVNTNIENDAYAYGLLFADVSRVIATHDPVGFIIPGHEDEYDLEIDDVIFVMTHADESTQIEELREVFVHWFDEGIADQFPDYAEMAHDIRNAMWMNGRRNPVYNPVNDG